MIKKGDVINFGVGAGSWPLMVYIIPVFCPIIIMMYYFGDLDSGKGLLSGLLAGVITAGFIYFLYKRYIETGKPGYKVILVGIYIYFYTHWSIYFFFHGNSEISSETGLDIIKFLFVFIFYFLLVLVYPIVVLVIKSYQIMGLFGGILSFLFWGFIFVFSIGLLRNKNTSIKLKFLLCFLLIFLYLITYFPLYQIIDFLLEYHSNQVLVEFPTNFNFIPFF